MSIKIPESAQPLREVVDELVVPCASMLQKWESDGTLQCLACAHRCKLKDGERGFCRIRFRDKDIIKVPYGYVAVVQIDPIEKKPLHHFIPGSRVFTFGMLGCDLTCGYCTNWITSQALRDKKAGVQVHKITAYELVNIAKSNGCQAVAASFNEPLITVEWLKDVLTEAKKAGLKTAVISNGHTTLEVVETIAPVLDAIKIDLKAAEDKAYKKLGARLSPILEAIKNFHAYGVHVEVATLIVPKLNDDAGSIRSMASQLFSISPLIPWHLIAFHKGYRMMDRNPLEASAIIDAASIGREIGLKYVYAGNQPGNQEADGENTYCHGCGSLLVNRWKLNMIESKIADGCCPDCGEHIPGVF